MAKKIIVEVILLVLRIHPLMQHFVVGEGLEMFLYFQNHKKTKLSHFFTNVGSFELCHKVCLQQYLSATLLTAFAVSVKFTGYSEALM